MCRQGAGWACTHILLSCTHGFAAYPEARLCRYTPLDAIYADGDQSQSQGQVEEFARVLPESRPVKGAQSACREAVEDP